MCESRVTGRITIHHSIALRTAPMATKTAVNSSMNTLQASWARASGTVIGTDTSCAPTTSLSCQPKPLAAPYLSTSGRGAASIVLWQRRQAPSAMRIGRAM